MKGEESGRKVPPPTRRSVLGLGLGAAGAALLGALGVRTVGEAWLKQDAKGDAARRAASRGELSARPSRVKEASPTGLHALGLEGGRDGLLYVPEGYRPDRPAPLALMLHGAGGEARHGLSLLRGYADRAGLIIVAPDSRRGTWDVIAGGYGPDVAYIERALGETFARYSVDPKRVAVGGFSDGASYALSLGLANGELFTHVIAFSPGFVAPARRQGRPRLFISHGTRDQVLPVQACSRRIVPQAERAGYDVLYREFEGPHTVPPEVVREAADWFLG